MSPEREVVDHVRPPAASPAADGERSTGELLGDIVGELQTIVRKEVELARHELREAVLVRGQAAAALVVAGLLGLIALACAVVAGAVALSLVMPRWAAWAVVSGGFLLLTGVALMVARTRARATPLEPERTRQSIEENVQWARTQLRR